MQQVRSTLYQFQADGIELWTEGGQLHFKAKKSILTDEVMQYLKQHKELIIKVLQHEQSNKLFPLTPIQSAYLLGSGSTFDYGGVSCHIYMEFDYERLEHSRVVAVWNQLIQRHEMLRTIINEDGYQSVLNEISNIEVPSTNLIFEGKDDLELLHTIREKLGNKTYQPDVWPLFDIALSHCTDRTKMHVSFDFLIADWASIWLLMSEFEALYFDNKSLPNIDFTFREYVKKDEMKRYQEKYKADRAYWHKRVPMLPTAPKLPQLPVECDNRSFERLFVQIDKEKWEILKRRIKSVGKTPTSVLFTLYSQCLAKWSTEKHFMINLILLNRQPLHEHVNRVVGDFTSVNLLEVDFRKERIFTEHVDRVQKQMFLDLDHSTYSGVDVMREITRQKGQHQSFMPFVFTSAIGLIDANNLRGSINEYGISQTPQVFIDCQVMDDQNGLRVNWDVRNGVFPEDVVTNMFEAFRKSLYNLIDEADSWQSSALIQLPEEQQRRRRLVNDTKRIIQPQLLHEGFFKNAEKSPHKIALIDGDTSYTYQQIKERSLQIGTQLLKQHVQPGDKVAVIMDKSVYQLTSVLAILSVGAVYVPIDKDQPIARIERIVEQSDVSVILVDEYIDLYNYLNRRIISCYKDVGQTNMAYELYHVQPSELAYIIFTSGSTGIPKGVAMSHQSAMNTILDMNERFRITSEDSVLALSKLNFDLSVYDIFGLLTAGGTIIYPEKGYQYDAKHWLELIQTYGVTVWNSVPSLMQMVLNTNELNQVFSSTLKCIFLSGDWAYSAFVSQCHRLFPESLIVVLGGATEAGIWSNYHIYQEVDCQKATIPYGYPLSNQRYYILDTQYEDCPDFVRGELYIAGDSLAEGYFNDEEKTTERFLHHFRNEKKIYKTGDFGRYLPNGEIEFIGRTDSQVKLNGNLVNLGEIESHFNMHHDVKQSCAVIFDSKYLYCAVEMKIGVHMTSEQLRDYIAQFVPRYMVPLHVFIFDHLERNSNDKLDRVCVKQRIKERIEKRKECSSDSPLNHKRNIVLQVEEEFLKLARDVFHLTTIQRNDNLYDYGADSLTLSQLTGKIKMYIDENFNDHTVTFDIILRYLLNEPKVALLAEYILPYIKSEEGKKNGEQNEEVSRYIGSIKEESASYEEPLRIIIHAGLGTKNIFKYLNESLANQQCGTILNVTVQDVNRYLAINPSQLIDVLADDYFSQIIKREPKQVQLVGYSMGGLIALEVSRKLLEHGVDVKDFTLIDSAPVPYKIEDSIALELIFITNFYITVEDVYDDITNQEMMAAIKDTFYQHNESLCTDHLSWLKNEANHKNAYQFILKLRNLSQEQRFKDYTAAIERRTGESIPLEMLEGYYSVYLQSFKGSNVQPMAYFGDIRYIMAEEDMNFIFTDRDKTRGFWKELCIGNFEEFTISGNHITCIEKKENAQRIAALLLEPFKVQPKRRDKKTIGIVGATGLVGQGATELLRSLGTTNLILGSRDTNHLINKYGPSSEAMAYQTVDVYDKSSIELFCSNCDLVINAAGPASKIGNRIAIACMKSDTHYVDVSGDKTMKQSIEKVLASYNGKANFVVSSGVYPGLVELYSAYLLSKQKKINSIHCYFSGKGKFSETGAYDIVASLAADEGVGMSYYKQGSITKMTEGMGQQILLPGKYGNVVALPLMNDEFVSCLTKFDVEEGYFYNTFSDSQMLMDFMMIKVMQQFQTEAEKRRSAQKLMSMYNTLSNDEGFIIYIVMDTDDGQQMYYLTSEMNWNYYSGIVAAYVGHELINKPSIEARECQFAVDIVDIEKLFEQLNRRADTVMIHSMKRRGEEQWT